MHLASPGMIKALPSRGEALQEALKASAGSLDDPQWELARRRVLSAQACTISACSVTAEELNSPTYSFSFLLWLAHPEGDVNCSTCPSLHLLT